MGKGDDFRSNFYHEKSLPLTPSSSFAKENLTVSGDDDDDDRWTLPPATASTSSQGRAQHRGSTTNKNSSTPLLPIRQRQPYRDRPETNHPRPVFKPYKDDIDNSSSNIWEPPTIFDQSQPPENSTSERRRLKNPEANVSMDTTTNMNISTISSDYDDTSRPTGLAGFFFGFMYEEPFHDSFDDATTVADPLEDHNKGSIWNPLNMALFASYTLTTAAATVPVLLVPTIGKDFLSDNDDETSGYASRAAASAVLGTACGKFLNGPVGDVLGARRTSVLYAMLLCLALASMGLCNSISSVRWACFYVEFFQSVQWPCILIILATHYGPQPSNHKLYESGIYITSIASRFGSLIGIPFFTTFLRHETQWRWVCFLGAWMALVAASVSHLFLADSPERINEPQNPLHPSLVRQLSDLYLKPKRFFRVLLQVLESLLLENLLPSLKHVLRSGTFWIVALAHTGSSMIRTSERILTTYFHDTSMGYLSQEKASGLSIFASLGTIVGLAVCGTIFTSMSQERQRKRFVFKLYIVTILSCYAMAILAIPPLLQAVDAPGLVLFFQILASFCMSMGIAVMFYQIPGLVGSAFGNHKGLFSAYVDGVAYGGASVVWKIVASTVSEDANGGGWAYGWAAVALLLILCGILMTEFFEHYFVRPSRRHGVGTYETIIFA